METYLKQFYQQQHENTPNIENSGQIFLSDDAKKHSQSPMVTGASILGIKFKGGVMLAGDTLGAWGKMARFRSIQRLERINKYTVIGGGGDIADFQYITKTLKESQTQDWITDDGYEKTPKEFHEYLTRIMYQRRNKFDPLWNAVVVAGMEPNFEGGEGKPFLGYVDLIGTNYEGDLMATGFGNYLAVPILRKYLDVKGGYEALSQQDAKYILDEALKVLFYRHCVTINKIQTAVITKQGVSISEPYKLQTDWEYEGFNIRNDDL